MESALETGLAGVQAGLTSNAGLIAVAIVAVALVAVGLGMLPFGIKYLVKMFKGLAK